MYVAGAVAAALLLGGGAYAATRGGDEPAAQQATSGATGSGTCPPTVALAVDPAWADPGPRGRTGLGRLDRERL